jgi:hypothetical protein
MNIGRPSSGDSIRHSCPERVPDRNDIQGLLSLCGEGHRPDHGICVTCGAWLPEAECRLAGCGWTAEAGESSLRAAVSHRIDHGHPVRVRVG